MARGLRRHNAFLPKSARPPKLSKEEKREANFRANYQALQHGMFLHYMVKSFKMGVLLVGVSCAVTFVYTLYESLF